MKKNVLYILYTISALGVICSWIIGRYNGLVTLEENVELAWSQVENQYQMRVDLVPNLVATVKGYATHERETLEGVVSARAKATQMTIDLSSATPEQMASYQAAQGELGQALGRLLVVAESYPNLKANENFQQLQSQLEGTENRITYARDLFNRTAQTYNESIRRFPNNMVAWLFGFDRKDYFQADQGANHAPEVEF